MAARGRQPGFRMPDSHRTKIANSKILNRLIAFAEGEPGVEMTPHQVSAATALLRKVMPDLQAMQLSGDEDNPIRTVTSVEWHVIDHDGPEA